VRRTEANTALREAVARARALADATGELSPKRQEPSRSPLPTEVGDALVALLRNGTYDEVVARVVAEHPELADS